ncbi:regulatory protein ArsR [Halothece sp. PCC 7418]|uniref:HTH arsR-type domain-containing protein n=1 Tax=Aphanothece halophytica TaxID=72020 RepID=Q9KI48_APHHA|nr:metalloregulator ArsR/SmtB family transcription factor [Halothece sp. PCC 7418]AAF72965.1 unknown [Aphanothece halophytica]AFZ43014.1 regulatory protein ArsR [Halothece sp. PCC 7418]
MSDIATVDRYEFLASRFKLLSEPTRLRILEVICGEERKVSDICERTGLQQANVSKQLQLLRTAGVVACRRVGTCRYYRVTDQELLKLCDRA